MYEITVEEERSGASPWLWAAVGVGLLLAGRAALRARRRMDFRDRVVLITGGSRGLGLILARQFAAEGARLAICARDPAELERARCELAGRGAQVVAIPCDVTDEDDVRGMVTAVEELLGPVDVLVNNAGVIQAGPVDTMTVDDFDHEMRTHFYGPLYTTLAVLPAMRARRSGRIVNISSIGGKVPVPHLLPYSASKFALVGLSEGLRAELAGDGVLVTTVCPGLIRTGSPRNAWFKGQHEKEYAWFSIGDSVPGPSMNAERAARRILDAAQHGEAEVILSVPARLAALAHGIAPGLTAEGLALADRLLPDSGGAGTEQYRGYESESAWAPSPLTTLTQQAAVRNNEL